ncbi:hypothetical protein ILUMI_15635 [Ignelater luminosus]|uniref:Uncharacterized protein n=1 Tax=Ignelater luminosus TaxID=2038154 RepID=A0A8K0CTQ7_IGNLU|nr:hypothetical protein ILUMI_15635 [Ignelater luminosus]
MDNNKNNIIVLNDLLRVAANNRENQQTLNATIASCDTPSNSREKQKRLDMYRKRQLQIEEERLVELKCLREAVDESNRINKKKLGVLQAYLPQLPRISKINL